MRRIADYYASQGLPTKNIVIQQFASFRDARRSPYDTGTTTKVRARIQWADGRTNDVLIKMFVAESDGYTEVETSTP